MLIKKMTLLFMCISMGLLGYSQNEYNSSCERAAKDGSLFANFKRDPIYRDFVENVTYEQGQAYLSYITTYYPDFIARFDELRVVDMVGNPIIFDYGQYGSFSPTTLRFIKIAGDLRYEFGDLSHMDIVELGRGHGGLCSILNILFGFQSYSLIDDSKCHPLINKTLQYLGINNVRFFSLSHPPIIKKFDLVISNFYFSELNRDLQREFINSLFISCRNGYLTNNYVTNNSCTSNELLLALMQQGKKGRIETENPSTSPSNSIYIWKGKNDRLANDKMKTENAVTYRHSAGRLGDNLIAYLHAKWISYKYGIPIVHNPFPYYDQFKLSQNDTFSGKFKSSITIEDESDFIDSGIPTLFAIPYFAEYKLDKITPGFGVLKRFVVDWEDDGFKREIADCIQPINPIKTLDLPQNCKTVAAHVRRGGGYDPSYINQVFVEKFPPDSYFIEQIKLLASYYYNKKLYVYILTDDQNPKAIADKYTAEINNPNVTIDYRKDTNNWRSNVLEDMFAMVQFDCLIRGESNFALVPQLIGNHEFVINAAKVSWQNGSQIVNQVEIFYNGTAKIKHERQWDVSSQKHER